jgi:N-acyl-D-amino-acid deacylase
MSIDYLIKDGFIIDGAERDCTPVKADIAIEGDCIRDTGNLSHLNATTVIDATGLCVCPGFIDVHSHSEFSLFADGRAEGKICQGITTEINGNCGLSAAPLYGPALERREKDLEEFDIKERWNTFSEYFSFLEKRRFATNFITLVGHGNLRASVIGYEDRALSENESNEIKALLREAMNEGARGLSTGLIYPPGIYSDTQEIVELAREIKQYNGIYATHMRSEGDMLIEAVDEVISVARNSGIRAQISHLKTSGEKNWKKLEDVFGKIDSAHKTGIALTCDRYPYTAAGTDLDAILPSWAFEGGHEKEMERLKSSKIQGQMRREILHEHPEEDYWDKITISSVISDKNKWMEGKSISEISRSLNKQTVNCLFDILMEERLNVGAIFFTMNEENLKAILKQPYTMIGSDSSARSFDGITAKGMPHPRGFGSFPRVLGRYVREERALTLSEAVHKMTGLPAKIFSIKQRGVIAKGYFADITIFDPEKVNGTAGFNNPFKKPEGIQHVLVNGVPVVFEGAKTKALPGRVLR